MKTALYLLIPLITAANTFAQEPAQVGRYQLVSGIVEIVGKGVSARENAVFRIDTETGKVFKYSCGAVGKDQTLREFWSYVPELSEAKARAGE
jgi:hypothetical protein